MKDRTYIAIDLKSFYASVECRERGLDPLDTNLVVADESRTDKTICLAVTPSLKSYGISGRGRLFEVKQRVKEANAGRQHDAPRHRLEGSSHFFSELQENPSLAIDFIIAPPRMAYYMEYSTRIYQVYMKYVAPEDIIVYSTVATIAPKITVEEIDTDYFVTFDHPMTKDQYLSFVAYVKSDRVFLNRLYPEQSPTCRFPITTGGKLFVYCIKHGLSVYSGNL